MNRINSVLTHWGNVVEYDDEMTLIVGYNEYIDTQGNLTKAEIKRYEVRPDEYSKMRARCHIESLLESKKNMKKNWNKNLGANDIVFDGGREYKMINGEVVMLPVRG